MSTNLLLQSISDFQLHEQDALARVQSFVQLAEGGVDVLLYGDPLSDQLLQNVSQTLNCFSYLRKPVS